MQEITIKRGQTFKYTGQLVEDDGITPVDISDYAITSQVRDKNQKLIDTLLAEITDGVNGAYSIESESTTAYPVDKLFTDLKIINASDEIFYTETIAVNVKQSMTA